MIPYQVTWKVADVDQSMREPFCRHRPNSVHERERGGVSIQGERGVRGKEEG